MDEPPKSAPTILDYRSPPSPSRIGRWCSRWAMLSIGLVWFDLLVLFEFFGRSDYDSRSLLYAATCLQLFGLVCAIVSLNSSGVTWRRWVLLIASVLSLVICVLHPMLIHN